MTDKYQNKYRIPSARLQEWDYGWNGSYFVTICTQNRKCYFGNINNCRDAIHRVSISDYHISEIGKITDKYWLQIPQQFPFVKLGYHIVMPNHVHGIIIIDKQNENTTAINTANRDAINTANRDAINRVSTGGITGNNNPMLHNNLSRIIRWYKGVVTFKARSINKDFAWQSRFHEHIIRNEKSYNDISEYIIHNPQKWHDDKFFN